MAERAISAARAESSRQNGAKSKGPVSTAGKRRAAANAMKHGLRARTFVLLQGEDPAAFRAFEQALRRELAPEGHLQTLLAARVAIAAWRLVRADRMESEILGEVAGHADPSSPTALGRALIRDGYGPRAFETLLRYRGTTLAEFWRALTALKALQAEAADQTAPLRTSPAPRALETKRTGKFVEYQSPPGAPAPRDTP